MEKILSDLTRIYLLYSGIYLGELDLTTWQYKHKFGYNWLDKNKLITDYVKPALHFIKFNRKIIYPLKSYSTLNNSHPKILIWVYFPTLISSKNIKNYLLNKLLQIIKNSNILNNIDNINNIDSNIDNSYINDINGNIDDFNIYNNILRIWEEIKGLKEFKEIVFYGNEEFKENLLFRGTKLEVRVLIPSEKLITFEGREIPNYCPITGERRYIQPPINIFKDFIIELIDIVFNIRGNDNKVSKTTNVIVINNKGKNHYFCNNDFLKISRQIWGQVRNYINNKNVSLIPNIDLEVINQKIYTNIKKVVDTFGQECLGENSYKEQNKIESFREIYDFFILSKFNSNNTEIITINIIEGGFDVISLALINENLNEELIDNVNDRNKEILVSVSGLSKTKTLLKNLHNYFGNILAQNGNEELQINIIFDNDVLILPFKVLSLLEIDKNKDRINGDFNNGLEIKRILLSCLEYITGLFKYRDKKQYENGVITENKVSKKDLVKLLYRFYSVLFRYLNEYGNEFNNEFNGNWVGTIKMAGQDFWIDEKSKIILETLRLSGQKLSSEFWNYISQQITFHTQLIDVLDIVNKLKLERKITISLINVGDYFIRYIYPKLVMKQKNLITFRIGNPDKFKLFKLFKFKDFNDLWKLLIEIEEQENQQVNISKYK